LVHLRCSRQGDSGWGSIASTLTFVSALTLFFSGSLMAQSTGALWGKVSDADGGVIPGVQVTLVNPGIGYKFTTKTDQNGRYEIAALAAGTPMMQPP